MLTSNLNVPGSAWILSQWWTKGGTTLSQSTMDQIQSSLAQQMMPVVPESVRKVYKGQTVTNVLQYLTQHGYTQWTRYQPGSRFWPFQWIEGGWLLALSVLLIAATIWLVRRRAT